MKEPRGIPCPDCGKPSRVIYSRPNRAYAGRLVRRRECRACGRRFTTSEAITIDPDESPRSIGKPQELRAG